MRPLLAALLLASLPGCGQDDAPELAFWQEGRNEDSGVTQRIETRTDGRVIDHAGVLSASDEIRVRQRAANVSRGTGLQVMVLTIRLSDDESLEHFGWAVRGNGDRAPVMLMVNPEQRSVRVDSGGKVAAEDAAAVVSAMRPALQNGRTAEALLAGLDRLASIPTRAGG